MIIVVLMSALVFGRGRATARGIFIDGKLAVLVRDKRAAEEVGQRLLARARGKLSGAASFKESWSDETCRTEGQPVVSVQEAVSQLAPKLTVLIQATAIRVAGKDLLAMADRQLAEAALEKLKQEYVAKVPAGHSVTQVKIRESVEIIEIQARPERIQSDVGAGVQVLKSASPGLTVRVVTEASKDVSYTVPAVEEKGETLPKGERRTIVEGRPGQKRVLERFTFDNGKLVKSETVSAQVIQEATPTRILVGVAAPAVSSGSAGE